MADKATIIQPEDTSVTQQAAEATDAAHETVTAPFVRGLTGGLSDYLAAAGMTAGDLLFELVTATGSEGQTIADDFTKNLEKHRQQITDTMSEHPVLTGISSTLGFVAGPGKAFGMAEKAIGGATATLPRAAQLAAQTAGQSATGALVGGTEAFVKGQDVATGAATGALAGAVPVAKGAGAQVAKAFKPAEELIVSAMKYAANKPVASAVHGIYKRNPLIFKIVGAYGGAGALANAMGVPQDVIVSTGLAALSQRKLSFSDVRQSMKAQVDAKGAFKGAEPTVLKAARYVGVMKDASLKAMRSALVQLPDYMQQDANEIYQLLEDVSKQQPTTRATVLEPQPDLPTGSVSATILPQ